MASGAAELAAAGATLLERAADTVRLAVVIVAGVFSRRSVRPLRSEVRQPLPGDEIVPVTKVRWTHAITIPAQPAEIWPWLAQMGCRRGGWYSYDCLDNGCTPSADRVIAGLQQVEVGDVLPWTPTAEEGFVVRAIEPERALMLGDSAGTIVWTFLLERIANQETRLIVRVNGTYERIAVGIVMRLLWRPIHFGMQRRQLINLKRRVRAAK